MLISSISWAASTLIICKCAVYVLSKQRSSLKVIVFIFLHVYLMPDSDWTIFKVLHVSPVRTIQLTDLWRRLLESFRLKKKTRRNLFGHKQWLRKWQLANYSTEIFQNEHTIKFKHFYLLLNTEKEFVKTWLVWAAWIVLQRHILCFSLLPGFTIRHSLRLYLKCSAIWPPL